MVSAGAKQKENESRTGLIERNFHILKSVLKSMKPFNPKCILLLVSNPVDVLTYFALKLSGLKQQQVFGSGTFLDTMRLRLEVADLLKVKPTATIHRRCATFVRLPPLPSTHTFLVNTVTLSLQRGRVPPFPAFRSTNFPNVHQRSWRACPRTPRTKRTRLSRRKARRFLASRPSSPAFVNPLCSISDTCVH